jgi:hypothetical protein
MAKKYRVLVRSFINNSIREEGEIVEYDGKPGSNLEPVGEDKPAKGKGKAEAPAGEETQDAN